MSTYTSLEHLPALSSVLAVTTEDSRVLLLFWRILAQKYRQMARWFFFYPNLPPC